MKEIFLNQESYFHWRLERVKRIEKRLPELFDVQGKKVLDIGCGAHAALAYYLSEKGASVEGGEIDAERVAAAKTFAPKANISLFFAESLPFHDETFDLVYLWDVLEHVKDPRQALREATRVCKKGGLVFVEFSPFWAYPTGHHLYFIGFPRGFLPFQFLPLSWTKKIVLGSNPGIQSSPESIFQQFTLLNKLSLNKFKKIVRKENLETKKEFYFISLPHREIKINFISYLPILRELFTMSYSGIFKK